MIGSDAIGLQAIDMDPSTTSSGDATASLPGVGASASVGVISTSGGAMAILSGVGAPAGVSVVEAGVGATLATLAGIRIVDGGGTPRGGLTGLKWAFFDQVTLDVLRAPSAQGAGAFTDGGGNLSVDIHGTQLQPGQTGLLMVSDGDGSLTQSPPGNAFLGPVEAA